MHKIRCACARFLCMHKILVHAQESCACTTLLCMHKTLVHAQESCACTRFLCMHKNLDISTFRWQHFDFLLTPIFWPGIHPGWSGRVLGASWTLWKNSFSLNMPLAYRVLTSIWKHMRSEHRGFGRSLAGARLKITMFFECHPQKRLVKFTFRSQNCIRTESGAILWNPAFRGFRKRMKTPGFWRFLGQNHEKQM